MDELDLDSTLPFAKLLILGAILLLSPIAVVVFQGPTCGGAQTACSVESMYKYVDTFLPYVMLSGGLIIGYSMKKIADSHVVETEDETETKE